MLYWIWFIALTSLGWLFAYRVWHEKGSDPGYDQLLCHGSMVMAISISWDKTVIPIFNWLSSIVPQGGTDIHIATVMFICGVLGVAWIAHPVFVGLIFMNDEGNVSISNAFTRVGKKQ